jgi:hypothetical protein
MEDSIASRKIFLVGQRVGLGEMLAQGTIHIKPSDSVLATTPCVGRCCSGAVGLSLT